MYVSNHMALQRIRCQNTQTSDYYIKLNILYLIIKKKNNSYKLYLIANYIKDFSNRTVYTIAQFPRIQIKAQSYLPTPTYTITMVDYKDILAFTNSRERKGREQKRTGWNSQFTFHGNDFIPKTIRKIRVLCCSPFEQ